ncbi:DUF221-domain-containing protein [Cylindrobasidium torrendii FP15055 ss-10]|uniref:DUF221-domain-containing protein n=1 Tax=Cylindrobasidium torrendii FP15055 ss-10 TaxID=1314674 RepID=A0A0D7B484_9AGAR|nr:DUF221-domain-containing protein [Cylindrobasidium torrendii FP15055 ss-10]
MSDDASDISNAKAASTKTFLTALTFNAIVFGVEIAAFTILRPYFKAIYAPRTYVPALSKRIKELPRNIILWPLAVFNADPKDIINANGLDAYFFVRFLRLMVKIFLPIWILSWAILLPVTSVNTRRGENTQLDLFVFGNVGLGDTNRYAAHIILVWIFTVWVLYNIKREMAAFIIKRQQYLINPFHSKSVQANTILITGVPAKYLTYDALMKLFNELPGGVKRIFINRDLKELPDIYDRQLAACNKLEGAETKLLSIASKLHLKGGSAEEAGLAVPQAQRPTHKLGFLGLFGEKVDSIEWARKEIQETTALLMEGRRKLADRSDDTYPAINSAFITFNKQISAHLGAQILMHHEPYRMTGRYIEIEPEDVIWSNLGMNPYEMKLRVLASYAATAGLILGWAFPVAFVGLVSNVYSLCKTASWLAWICTIPKVVLGIIAGILPPVALAILMMLLPIILRLFARFEGIPQRSGLELSLMSRFFIFQVLHGFLIVTLSSGIIASLQDLINSPTSIPGILAENLPNASTFFLTYIILQGLSGTAGGFLQIVRLIIYYVKLVLLASTPRSVWGIKYVPPSVAWGTTFPGITLLSTISFGYMIISPIINGFACATFFLFYLMYKYLFLWVYQQPNDTGGLFYPKALQHIFVGMYVQQVCLAALFFLVRDESGKAAAIPQGALTIVLIVVTIIFNMMINNSYGPLLHSLPLSLVDKMKEAVGEDDDEPYRAETIRSETKLRQSPDGSEEMELSERSEKRSSTELLEGGSKKKDKDFFFVEPMAERYQKKMEWGFQHPAASRPQRPVWMPLGTGPIAALSKSEASDCYQSGVDVSLAEAEMNEKGKVDVSGPPPDLVRDE